MERKGGHGGVPKPLGPPPAHCRHVSGSLGNRSGAKQTAASWCQNQPAPPPGCRALPHPPELPQPSASQPRGHGDAHKDRSPGWAVVSPENTCLDTVPQVTPRVAGTAPHVHRAAPRGTGQPPRAPGSPLLAPGSAFVGIGQPPQARGGPPRAAGSPPQAAGSPLMAPGSPPYSPQRGFREQCSKPNPLPRRGAAERGDRRWHSPEPRRDCRSAALSTTGSSRCCRSPPGAPSSGGSRRGAAQRDDGPRQVRPWGCPSDWTGARDSGPPGWEQRGLRPGQGALPALSGTGTGSGRRGSHRPRARRWIPSAAAAGAEPSRRDGAQCRTQIDGSRSQRPGKSRGRGGAGATGSAPGSWDAGGCGRAGGACGGLVGPPDIGILPALPGPPPSPNTRPQNYLAPSCLGMGMLGKGLGSQPSARKLLPGPPLVKVSEWRGGAREGALGGPHSISAESPLGTTTPTAWVPLPPGCSPTAGEAPQNPGQQVSPLVPHPTVGGWVPPKSPQDPHPHETQRGCRCRVAPPSPGPVGGARGRAERSAGGLSGAELTGAPRLVPLPPPVPDQGEGCCVSRRHQRWEQGPGVLHAGHGTGSAPAGLGGSGTDQRPPPRGSARSALTPPEPRRGDASCPPHRQGPPVSSPCPPPPVFPPPPECPLHPGFLYPGTRRLGGASPPVPVLSAAPPVSPTRYDLHGQAGCGQVRAGCGQVRSAERGRSAAPPVAAGAGGGGQGAGADINNRGPSPSPS